MLMMRCVLHTALPHAVDASRGARISMQISNAPNNQRAKEDALRFELNDPDSDSHMLAANVPLPMDPDLVLSSIVSEV
jgi:hypothetical protein